MTNSTDLIPPAGTTHTIKPEYSKSPLWNVIKALGNKCFYYNGIQWFPVLDESYLDYYLKFYDAVTHEEIPTETPEEAEAFNKMKPYEFDEHVSGGLSAQYKDDTQYFGEDVPRAPSEKMKVALKEASRYVTVPVTVEGNNGDKIACTEKKIAIVGGVEIGQHSGSGFLSRCITIPNRPVFIKPEFNKPVFTQAMADKGGAKYDHGKPRYDLLPAIAIDEMAKVLTFGAEKYSPNSWQNIPDAINRYRAALLRHTFAIQRGELIDDESGLPHSALAMTNAAFIVELEKKC